MLQADVLAVMRWHVTLCKKESQEKSKKNGFQSWKVKEKSVFCDFSLTFPDQKLFFLTLPDFLFYRVWQVTNVTILEPDNLS